MGDIREGDTEEGKGVGEREGRERSEFFGCSEMVLSDSLPSLSSIISPSLPPSILLGVVE